MRIVMKFGGTSVGDGSRIMNVADLVADNAAQGHELVVAVSAMGGVTDLLIRAARRAALGDAPSFVAAERDLRSRHIAAIEQAVVDPAGRAALQEHVRRSLDTLVDFCTSIQILGELTPRALDTVASLGERLCAPIIAQALGERGCASQAIEATQLIVTDDHFGAATPIIDETRAKTRTRLLPLIETGVIPVVTGFLGATRSGITTTLGRGGSDFTGTILGRALDAAEVWIWTDVNGVMTADPRIVPQARTLAEIAYAEAAELSHFGAKVIHPQTIAPAADGDIPIRILNTFNPSHPGTRIVRTPTANHRAVKAITAIRNLSQITVEGRGMQGIPGVAAKVFAAVARQGISVLMISQASSEQSICFVIETAAAAAARAALDQEFELERLRHSVDRVWAQKDVVIVAIVGAGLRGTPGIAARVFGALGSDGINVISIAMGSSEYNLSIVVHEKDADAAVRSIHAGLDLDVM